jgi:hypothetical protein
MTFLGAAVVALVVFGPVGASAFHDGGVAHCDGCHTMHNSDDNPFEGSSNALLLKGTDASSTCLNCHGPSRTGSYHVLSNDGSNTNQGGDYYWMMTTYSSTFPRGTRMVTVTSPKDEHGHNVIAFDFGLDIEDTSDPNGVANTFSPGGNYPAASLACTSCHDPHGSGRTAANLGSTTDPIAGSGSYGEADPNDAILGNYRLLGDSDYVAPTSYAFVNDAPIARAKDTAGSAVDYGQGMSEWCANCHGDYNVESTLAHKHPASDTSHLNGIAANYNAYVATGDMTGSDTTSFDGLVPFERGEGDRTALSDDPEGGPGPDSNSNVMCLTCHRAHASAFANAGRWDFEIELLTHSYALHDNGEIDPNAAIYYKNGSPVDIATTYGEYQRSLCNKCHVQD